MNITQRLKQYERQMVFLRWGGSAEYGKINYVGTDFVEFEVLDLDSMEYSETVVINTQILLEVIIKGSDISRILAEYSSTLPDASRDPVEFE